MLRCGTKATDLVFSAEPAATKAPSVRYPGFFCPGIGTGSTGSGPNS